MHHNPVKRRTGAVAGTVVLEELSFSIFLKEVSAVRVEAGGTGISFATVWSRALLAQNPSQHASVIPSLAKSARAGHPVRWCRRHFKGRATRPTAPLKPKSGLNGPPAERR
jgi:hypothetical protein